MPIYNSPSGIYGVTIDYNEITAGVVAKRNETTSDPTVNSDNVAGYSVGSLWTNTATNRTFIANSVATGAAYWTDVVGVDGGGVS